MPRICQKGGGHDSGKIGTRSEDGLIIKVLRFDWYNDNLQFRRLPRGSRSDISGFYNSTVRHRKVKAGFDLKTRAENDTQVLYNIVYLSYKTCLEPRVYFKVV